MSKILIPAQRRERIHEYLAIHKIARNIDLSLLLNVSEATIRRDLEWLEKAGIVERTHGGAIISQRLNLEQEYEQRALRHPDEKRRIGMLAASLIEDGDIVFINSGTTTTQLIRQIRSDADVTIITNNLVAVMEARDMDFEILLLGGSFQPKSNSVAGRFAVQNLSQIYASKAFIGVDGISLRYGCTVPSNPEAELIHLMCEHCHGPITVVTDCSKWGVVSKFEATSINQINRLISDNGLDAAARASLAARSVEVLIAEGSSIKI